MHPMIIIIFLGTLHEGVSAEYRRFDNYQLIEARPQVTRDLAVLNALEHNELFEVDFWDKPRKLGKSALIMVNRDQSDHLMKVLKRMNPLVRHENVQALVKDILDKALSDNARRFLRRDNSDEFRTDEYHRYYEILRWLRTIVDERSDIASLESIGRSYEDRDLVVVKIGIPTGWNKPGYWIDAGMHAREWVAPSTAVYIINELISKSDQYTDVLRAVDFYIMPMVNPDGYEYTFTDDRLWRKTRKGPYCNSTGWWSQKSCCEGVDPNRNFEFEFGVSGTSFNPCKDDYGGPSPFSEPETRSLARYIRENKHKLKAAITLHSFGEDILYPYGYDFGVYPPDVNDLIAAGHEIRDATEKLYGTRYTVGNSASVLYKASGASDDWMKHLGIKYVYTIELRPGNGDKDNDRIYSFALPERYIIPTAEEIWQGMLTLVDRIKYL